MALNVFLGWWKPRARFELLELAALCFESRKLLWVYPERPAGEAHASWRRRPPRKSCWTSLMRKRRRQWYHRNSARLKDLSRTREPADTRTRTTRPAARTVAERGTSRAGGTDVCVCSLWLHLWILLWQRSRALCQLGSLLSYYKWIEFLEILNYVWLQYHWDTVCLLCSGRTNNVQTHRFLGCNVCRKLNHNSLGHNKIRGWNWNRYKYIRVKSKFINLFS